VSELGLVAGVLTTRAIAPGLLQASDDSALLVVLPLLLLFLLLILLSLLLHHHLLHHHHLLLLALAGVPTKRAIEPHETPSQEA